jgi:hypothetical protein
MSARLITFEGTGPFDDDEQALIEDVARAVVAAQLEKGPALVAAVSQHVTQLERLGALVQSFPSLLGEQALGERRRGLTSLLELLSHSDLSSFDMFLPTRALLSRILVMGEVNFYRMLRLVCAEALGGADRRALLWGVDRRLCHCLYARLVEEVLKHIASDQTVNHELRERAVLALMQLWDNTTYRVSDFFPVLEATWDARRHVPATLGTLMGAAEMFGLLEAGCDDRFVDYLVRPSHSEDEAAAFREFLFGATTEQLGRMAARLESGSAVVAAHDLGDSERLHDAYALEGDPALAMFEFFLSRHMQAAVRRQAKLPGPKRTAEEYVMLHFLRKSGDKELPSEVPPPPPARRGAAP